MNEVRKLANDHERGKKALEILYKDHEGAAKGMRKVEKSVEIDRLKRITQLQAKLNQINEVLKEKETTLQVAEPKASTSCPISKVDESQ